VLLLEQLERHTHTAVLAAATFRAAGADNVEIPDWEQVRRDFDTQLAAEPVELATDDRTVLLRALGLR
jgi:hypothetical protein